MTTSSVSTPDLSPKDRLKAVQKRLEDRGVLDVKLTFAPGFEARPLTELYSEVAEFIEAYLDGKMVPLECVGDGPSAVE